MKDIKRIPLETRIHKSARGNASQFFVAGELCRRGFPAVVTLGNTPNTDILCSNMEGTHFVHIQVKTFVPGSRNCSVGRKSELNFGPSFFWALGGIPVPGSNGPFEYYIIPASVMSARVTQFHRLWLETPGKNGRPHEDSGVRTVDIPPFKSPFTWNIAEYRDRWDLIEEKLSGEGDLLLSP